MATGKQIRDRAFALSGALLFFITSIALTVVVIVQIVSENNAKKAAANAATVSGCSTPQEKVAGKLQGAKLACFTPLSGVTELKTSDLKKGTGQEITSVNNTVTADYTGALVKTGVIFQSSLDGGQPFTTKLSGVIPGWQTGMIGMKAGGVRRMVIPAAQAYGAQAQSGIPANSDLVFDVTLRKVE